MLELFKRGLDRRRRRRRLRRLRRRLRRHHHRRRSHNYADEFIISDVVVRIVFPARPAEGLIHVSAPHQGQFKR